jgi:hypothetical protein
MASVTISPHRRALRLSLVSGVLVGLLTLLGTPLSSALSAPQPLLVRKPHRAAGVRWCAAYGQAEAQAQRCGQGSSRHVPRPQASWIMWGNAGTEPSEPGSDSDDCPDPLERVPPGVPCPALACAFVPCPPVAGTVLLRIPAVQSRAPPVVIA